MTEFVSVAVIASMSLNGTIVISQLTNSIYQRIMRYWRFYDSTQIIISRASAGEIFAGFTMFLSSQSKSYNATTLITIAMNNGNSGIPNVFMVPEAGTYAAFIIDGIEFHVLPLALDGINVSAYRLWVKRKDKNKLYEFLSGIMLRVGITEASIHAIFSFDTNNGANNNGTNNNGTNNNENNNANNNMNNITRARAKTERTKLS